MSDVSCDAVGCMVLCVGELASRAALQETACARQQGGDQGKEREGDTDEGDLHCVLVAFCSVVLTRPQAQQMKKK